MKNLFRNLKFGTGNMLVESECENFTVIKPRNSWDMNYELIDFNEKMVYLIDIDDICDDNDKEDISHYEENGGLLYSDLINLEIDIIKENTWKSYSLSEY